MLPPFPPKNYKISSAFSYNFRLALTPEVIDGTEISAFKKDSWVNAEGTQYNYADAIQYDDDVLDEYDQNNMKDTTYRIFLDKYGYAIGVEIIEEADNYVFLTGIDGRTSNLVNKTAEGNIIHLDGTMETVKINMEKSRALKSSFAITDPANTPYTVFKPAALWNTWCTYTVDGNGVYTLTQVANTDAQMNADDNGVARTSSKRTTDKVGQGWDHTALTGDNVGYTTIIDKSHIGLDGFDASYSVVYGNDDTIYINASVSRINDADKVNPYTDAGYPDIQAVVIDDVDSVATGAQNVSLKAYNYTTLNKGDTSINVDNPGGTDGNLEAHYSYGVYNLFDSDGFVIAAVVVGEDDGTSSAYAYAYNDTVSQEAWGKDSLLWTWTKTVIIDGEEVTLTEVGDSLSGLKSMTKNNWYEVKLKADGTVKSVTAIQTLDAAGPYDPETDPAGTHTYATDSANEADNVKDDIFCTNVDHFGGRATDDRSGTGNKYPKYIGKIEMVRNALEDNSSGKVVLFENMYTGNSTDIDPAVINGEALKYTLSAAGNSLQVMNATGGRVKGFSISPNAKTVLVQDKRVINDDGSVRSTSAMSSREYFTGGKAGLEAAISKLNLNKNATGERFRGYVSAVFENGVAQTVIIYEKLPNDVNWGSNTGSSGSNTDNIKVDLTDPENVSIEYVGEYSLEAALDAIIKALSAKGYNVTNMTVSGGVYYFETEGGKYPLTFQWDKNDTTEMVDITVNGGKVRVDKSIATAGALATAAGLSNTEVGKWFTIDGDMTDYNTGSAAVDLNTQSVFDFGYYKVTLNTVAIAGAASGGGASTVAVPDDMEAAAGDTAVMYVKADTLALEVELTLTAATTGVVIVGSTLGTVDNAAITSSKAIGYKQTVTVNLTEANVKSGTTITLSLTDKTGADITVDGVTKSFEAGATWNDVYTAFNVPRGAEGNWAKVTKTGSADTWADLSNAASLTDGATYEFGYNKVTLPATGTPVNGVTFTVTDSGADKYVKKDGTFNLTITMSGTEDNTDNTQKVYTVDGATMTNGSVTATSGTGGTATVTGTNTLTIGATTGSENTSVFTVTVTVTGTKDVTFS